MKKLGYVFLLLIVVAAAAGAYVLSRSFTARTTPGAIETAAARRLRHFAIPRGARQTPNPVAVSDVVMKEAKAHFADHCAVCHANDGSGGAEMGKALYPKPPDMRLADTQDLTDGELYFIIHNGVRFTGMPAFGDESLNDRDEDTWKLVHFIRHLPKITPEEVQEMKALNPKSPAELAEEEEIRRFLQGEDVPPTEEHQHHH
jgi:mono/diheme cytochrome c family protein